MEFDKAKYQVVTWKNFSMLFWIINPGLFINEIFLGQRIPKVLLFDKSIDKPLMERQFVPCPHCGKLNDGRLWAKQNALKNWYGYYCPSCGKIIPCLRNLISLLFIIVTFPLWIWFVKKWKQDWLNKQSGRFENFHVEEITHTNTPWQQVGFSWGGFMYICMVIIFPLINSQEITVLKLLIGFPFWMLAGLGFGYMMKSFMAKKPVIDKSKNNC